MDTEQKNVETEPQQSSIDLKLTKCGIRNWQEQDAESLAEHANDRDIWLGLHDTFPHPYTLDDAHEWIELARSTVPETACAIIVEGKAVGGIGFMVQKDVLRKSAEIGYWLGKRYWGKGIATEALKALTDYAFQNYDIVRIHAQVYEGNEKSCRVLERAGYELEATLKKSVFKDNRIMNRMVYVRFR